MVQEDLKITNVLPISLHVYFNHTKKKIPYAMTRSLNKGVRTMDNSFSLSLKRQCTQKGCTKHYSNVPFDES